jgi:hypothetical protein
MNKVTYNFPLDPNSNSESELITALYLYSFLCQKMFYLSSITMELKKFRNFVLNLIKD